MSDTPPHRPHRSLSQRLRRIASLFRHGPNRLDDYQIRIEALSEQTARLEAELATMRARQSDQRRASDTLAGRAVVDEALLALTHRPMTNAASQPITLSDLPDAPSVSVVINTCDRAADLAKTLLGLRYLRYPAFEVVVVAGPCHDDTVAMLERDWAQSVKVEHCPDRNLSRSRNIGIATAGGDIVAFLDDDAVPEPDWLDRLVAGYTDASVGAVGGYARDASGIGFQARAVAIDRFGAGDVAGEANALASQPFATRFPSMIGVNSSFRRDALVALGGFDETYAFWLDEADVVARLTDAGLAVHQVPQAEVHHAVAPGETRDASGRTRAWDKIARSRAYFALTNARPDTALETVIDALAEEIGGVLGHVRAEREQGVIAQDQYLTLRDGLVAGTALGVRQAFSGARETVDLPAPPAHKAFAPLREPASRRRIAFVTGLYPPRPLGGVAVFIRHLAMALAREGHETTVVTFAQDGTAPGVAFEDGVWVHRIAIAEPEAPQPGTPDMPPLRWAATHSVLAELDRVAERRNFEWVVGSLWDVDLAATIASKRYRTLLYIVTGSALMAAEDPGEDERRMIAAERWALENATRVASSTDAARRDSERAYTPPLDLAHAAIVPFGMAAPQRTAEGGSARTTLLFVGRFEARKGVDVLLSVLPELLTRNPALDVILAGDNTLATDAGEPYWDAFARENAEADWFDRVTAPGRVSDDALEALYATCDIFVAPSRYESFGLIYLEAMRYGKPVIACDAGGAPEVVRDQKEGLLVPPGEAAPLEAAIQTLIDDEALRGTLGAAGQARFEAHFTIPRFAETFLAALDEGAGDPKRPS